MSAVDRKYLQLVAEWNAKGSGIVKKRIIYQENWWQISLKEAKKFGIDPHLNNALCLAYTRYQNMLGITDSGIWEESEGLQDMRKYIAYTEDNPGAEIWWRASAAARFMSEICNLPYKSCTGYVEFVKTIMEQAGLVVSEHTYH
ncbi:hypothetical protein GC177_00545 [bacterium]|nr:hypothetical protein [bacterium]